MSAFKGTPGPYHVDESGVHVMDSKSVPIALVYDAYSTSEAEATARLIAAAPALLEALEKIANWSVADGSHAFGTRLQVVAREAIAIALGEVRA